MSLWFNLYIILLEIRFNINEGWPAIEQQLSQTKQTFSVEEAEYKPLVYRC